MRKYVFMLIVSIPIFCQSQTELCCQCSSLIQQKDIAIGKCCNNFVSLDIKLQGNKHHWLLNLSGFTKPSVHDSTFQFVTNGKGELYQNILSNVKFPLKLEKVEILSVNLENQVKKFALAQLGQLLETTTNVKCLKLTASHNSSFFVNSTFSFAGLLMLSVNIDSFENYNYQHFGSNTLYYLSISAEKPGKLSWDNSSLKKLKELSIEGQITEWPSFDGLDSLKTLKYNSYTDQVLDTFPTKICSLSNLEEFNSNVIYKYFPESISNLSKVQLLPACGYGNYDTLPSFLSSLVALEKFSLVGIDHAIDIKILQKLPLLKELQLVYNNGESLSKMAADIAEISSLSILNIAITSKESEVFLPSIIYLGAIVDTIFLAVYELSTEQEELLKNNISHSNVKVFERKDSQFYELRNR